MSIDEFESIHSHVIMNWDTIISDPYIAKVLDMDLNKFCKKMKQANPYMMNMMIQANILSWLLFMLYIMCTNNPDYRMDGIFSDEYDIIRPD